MDLDYRPKVFAAIIALIALAVGGGIYGSYLKTSSKALYPQEEARILLQECVVHLQNSHSPSDIEAFLRKVEDSQRGIDKSEAIVTGVSLLIGGAKDVSGGMGKPLAMCLVDLQSRLDQLNLDENG